MNCWHLLVCWLQVSDPEKVKSVLTPASAQFLDYRSSVDQDPSFAKHFPIPRPVKASLRVLEEMKQCTRSTKCLVSAIESESLLYLVAALALSAYTLLTILHPVPTLPEVVFFWLRGNPCTSCTCEDTTNTSTKPWKLFAGWRMVHF